MDTLRELNLFLSSLSTSSKFAANDESLAFFESVYHGVKESLKTGVFTKFRKKENEPFINKVLYNFETYILQSRNELVA